jgi:hypothetical protein
MSTHVHACQTNGQHSEMTPPQHNNIRWQQQHTHKPVSLRKYVRVRLGTCQAMKHVLRCIWQCSQCSCRLLNVVLATILHCWRTALPATPWATTSTITFFFQHCRTRTFIHIPPRAAVHAPFKVRRGFCRRRGLNQFFHTVASIFVIGDFGNVSR